MKVHFYSNFTKRPNSSKMPTGTADELELVLKEDTSIEEPSFVLSGQHFDYNYAYVPAWNRYYFVNNITSICDGLYQLDLTEDYLASWKSQIQATSAHVVYSSTGYDKDIIDPRISQYITKQWQTDAQSGGGFGGGCFVLNTLSKDSGYAGFQNSYLLNAGDMQTLANFFLDLDVNSWIAQAVYNPMDCIVSCKWYPLDYSTIASACCSSGAAYIGSLPIGQNLPIITTPIYTNSVTFSLTPRYNDFRRLSASNYQMFVPYAGVFPIAQDEIIKSNGALQASYYIDLITGSMLIAEIAGGTLCNMFEVGFGVDCPLASVQGGNIGNFVESLVGAVAGVGASLAGGNIAGAVGSAAAGIAGATKEAITQRYRSRGTQGSRAYLYQGNYFRLIEDAWDTENPNSTNYIAKQGRPVFQTHAISNHSGYVQCEGASVEMAGLESEKERVNSYLNSGFYLE